MIAKPFYLLKKIIFITKFTTNLKKKSFLQQISNNQTKQSKLKTPFYHYPYSNNLISFKMTFIGLIFV
ncbi:hypothetical protein DDP45_00520 [Helicobacter pylori]|nr:hypothetical protein DDP36_00520 [Helicobacter pylori]RDY82438.1 hypothetical protein DDP35_00290 [Helicobacter pylori]RDY82639.1 hypothetical protein DDP45_00520 [Helicobacter pylori]